MQKIILIYHSNWQNYLFNEIKWFRSKNFFLPPSLSTRKWSYLGTFQSILYTLRIRKIDAILNIAEEFPLLFLALIFSNIFCFWCWVVSVEKLRMVLSVLISESTKLSIFFLSFGNSLGWVVFRGDYFFLFGWGYIYLDLLIGFSSLD